MSNKTWEDNFSYFLKYHVIDEQSIPMILKRVRSELSLARKERDEEWMKAIEGMNIELDQETRDGVELFKRVCREIDDIKQKMGGKE